MLKRHSNIIFQHLTQLGEKTIVGNLVPSLISNNVFSEEMIQRILTESENEKLQAISIYLAVDKRGPYAFHNLITALIESNHTELANTLKCADIQTMHATEEAHSSTNPPLDSPDSCHDKHHCQIPSSSSRPFKLPTYFGRDVVVRESYRQRGEIFEFGEQFENKPVEVQLAAEFKNSGNALPGYYKMSSYPRGYALIVNNIVFSDYSERRGAEKDEEALVSLLEQLYFEVELHRNKTRREMVDITDKFAARNWSGVDCAFIVFMSHGKAGHTEQDTEIVAVDSFQASEGYKTRDIIACFHHDNCPQLINKPKIFIFQSCRGNLKDFGIELEYNHLSHLTYRTETDGRVSQRQYRDRTRSDIFVIHPVPPGIEANRDIFTGTWFIQALVDTFAKYAKDSDLEDLIKIVDQRIKFSINMVGTTNFQTVTTESVGWNKKLFFNPGLHNQNDQVASSRLQEPQGMDVVDTPSECQMNGRAEASLIVHSDSSDNESAGCLSCWPRRRTAR